MSVTSVRLEDELQAQLEQAAQRLDRPKSWIINEALASWLEREESRERMYRETLEGLADLEAGRVVDGDEVMTWIASWGTENELPCPTVPKESRGSGPRRARSASCAGCTSSSPSAMPRRQPASMRS